MVVSAEGRKDDRTKGGKLQKTRTIQEEKEGGILCACILSNFSKSIPLEPENMDKYTLIV